MRAAVLLCLALAGVAAYGQSHDQRARQIMAEALGQIRLETALSVEITGKETFGETEIPTYVVLGFQRGLVDSTQTAWLEARTYRQGVLTHRLAGDGENVWSWSRRTNDYSSSAYQNLSASRNDFLSRLVTSSARWTSREADFAVRFLNDVFLGTSAQSERWSPWIGVPTATIVEEAELACTISMEQSAQNTWLRYDLQRTEVGLPWELTSVRYYRSQIVNKKTEVFEWTASILPGVVPEDVSFAFLPPAGAKPRASGGL